tara:strand:- start:4364 stop:6928 length:2565 start_codon:yes stop_codon:yes gene_type:complete
MFNLINTKEQLNKIKNKLSLGVLGAVAAVVPQTTEAQDRQIEEVVVSATKKDESASKVPVTVTALTEETLQEINVANFDEYIEYLPNVTNGGRGPGQSTIYIRGMSVDPVNVFLSAAQGSAPNVALYLDEQPIQVPGRNLDVYVADMERIEVLPGPQGTLFGASSQAGTVRLITNKPKYNVSEGGINAKHFATSNGDPSYAYDAFLNVPLINDVWAVRGVFYKTHSGGYIDNVSGTWSGEGKGFFYSTTPTFVEDDNADFQEDNFNTSAYEGFRVSSAYSFNDDWEMLVVHSHQDIDADGVFDYDPAIGDLKVQRFQPDTLDDSFDQTSLTLEGRIGKLDVVYTTAYLERVAEQLVDYSGYANVGAFLPYYVCNAYDYTTCGSATTLVDLFDDNERTTHEFRISSNELSDLPFSYTAGIFIDESTIETKNDYNYLGVLDPESDAWGPYQENIPFGCGAPNDPYPNAWSADCETRPVSSRFFNDIQRVEEQTAYFAEVTVPVTDKLDVMLGARKYDMDIFFRGQSKFGYRGTNMGQYQYSIGRDYESLYMWHRNLGAYAVGHSKDPLSLKDTITKLTLSYQQDENTLIYFTRSEGFRPGGFNRGGLAVNTCARNDRETAYRASGVWCGTPGEAGYRAPPPLTYQSDEVTNTEIGIKTLMLDGSLRLNATAYWVDWTDIQVSQFDPGLISLLTFIENAADAEISGFEADVLWYPTDTLTVAGAISLNDTEITNDLSQTIEITGVGSSLPLAPETQYNVRVRHDSETSGRPSYSQIVYKYSSDTTSSMELAKSLPQDSYAIVDLAYGISMTDNTDIEFFIRNATDERANLYYNDQDDIPRISTNRPRNIGVRIAYRF